MTSVRRSGQHGRSGGRSARRRAGKLCSEGRWATASEHGPRGERLARYLARCGVASRRRAEEAYIATGRVSVDGRVVTNPGTVLARRASVRVDGRLVVPEEVVTLALHKPAGVLSTTRDPRGRLTVLDLVPDPPARLYPVGRLDYDSEGLLLLSNDGPLVASLLHPRHAVARRYALLVAPAPDERHLERLCGGVRLSDGLARAVSARRLPGPPRGIVVDRSHQRRTPGRGGEAWMEMVLREGRNRQARRMCASLGLDVLRLVRVAIGDLQLGDLEPGGLRRLSFDEVAVLRGGARRPPPGRDGAPPAGGRHGADPRPRGPARQPGGAGRAGRPADRNRRPPAGPRRARPGGGTARRWDGDAQK